MNSVFTKFATSLIVVLVVSFSCVASAATGNWYSSVEECRERAEGGRVIQYIPAPNQARAKRAIEDGATIAPLQASICVEMQVIDGNFHAVYIPQGTEMLWKGGELYGHATCGNKVQGGILQITQAQVAVQGPAGPQGERGEQGPPGRNGVTEVINRYVPAPPQGGTTSGYSGRELARDLGHDLVWGFVTDRVTGKVTRAWVERERIRAYAQVETARIHASRPAPVTNHINIAGNCNAVSGSTVNCSETVTNNPAQIRTETVYVDRDRPVYIDRPVLVPIPGTGGGPVYTPPAEPVNRPSYTPPAEPVFGGGLGYNQPAGPIGGGGLSDPTGNPSYTQPVEPNYNQPTGPQCSAPPCG